MNGKLFFRLPAMRETANQFATLVSREKDMQCDELSRKGGHWLP